MRNLRKNNCPRIHRILLHLAFLFIGLFSSVFTSTHSFAVDSSAIKVRIYKLESIELKGTTRMTADQIAEEFNLSKGAALDDEFVLSTRAKLLSLGLFKSAILVMRRGNEKGWAKLIIEVEDDDNVLTDWALGGSFGVTQSESQASSGKLDSAPLGYTFELVGRNLFSALHRGSTLIDIDGEGVLRKGILTYGLPRFAKEDVQFDMEIGAIDVNRRYIDAMGFGGWAQGLWTNSFGRLGHLQYGAAMFVNSGQRYTLPGFPKSVAGPKIGFYHESRLKAFVPNSGYVFGASLLLAPIKTEHSLFEIKLAKTFDLLSISRFTIGADVRAIGAEGYSVRGESRFDLPFILNEETREQGEIFVRLRSGFDIINETELFGSSATFGLRYHSSGFIAEFALKVTRIPEALDPKEISPLTEGDE